MKHIIITIILLITLVYTSTAQVNETKLLDIKKKLDWQTPTDSLNKFIIDMEELRKTHDNPYLNYWEAYAIYILHVQIQDTDKKRAEKIIGQGIDLLESIRNKNSEHYALLSLLQGMEIIYANSFTVPFKAATDESNARKAIQLDPNNLRGYYALAIKDIYTPTMFGGGKIVEENLLKAISLSDKSDENPYAPDWGKPDAYRYLIRFYKKREQLEKAKNLMHVALSKYPKNESLIALNAKL